MKDPIREYVFRNVDGVWRDVTGDGDILADVLLQYDLVVDDKAQFVRFIDYEHDIYILYRAYNDAKITLTIWRLE